ncbi:MAG: DUF4815 domain-containing protein, partial [Nitrosotalea sp.]
MLNFDVAPFYDDFESAGGAKTNNYMRILFRPGYAVQARELTQLQSIVQNQIKSFGNHIFQDGSPVFGGHLSLDTSVSAIILNQQYANVDINLSDFLVGDEPTLITNASGTVTTKAVVVATDDSNTNPIILVKYLTGNKFQSSDVIQVASGVQTQAQLVSANSSNPATTVSINDGIFYSGGFFVQVNPQTIVLDSSTITPTYRVGLEIQESIVDEITDINLLDPAQGSFNYQAPGAKRYQYVLALSKRTIDSIDDSAFYELLRVENGLITKQIEYPIYADLDKTFARRTYDQAGNFTVKPFVISLGDNIANSSQYTITAEPGKAYVKGFEFETIGTQKLYGDKALATNSINSYGMSMEFGSILTVANLFSGNTGFFDISNFANVDLHIIPSANINSNSSIAYSNTKIGTARIRDVEFLGLGQYYAYITDVAISQNSFIASAGSGNTITFPSGTKTAYANAFANVIITVNTGGIVDSKRIVSWVSGTGVATLDSNLSITANATSNCTLAYAIKDVESVVAAPANFTSNLTGNVFYNQNTSAAFYSCMDIAVGGKNIAGNTVLSDTQFNKLIFALPQNYVAQNTISNATFFHRKNLFSQTFTSGNLAITSGSGLGTGETFPYGFTASFLPDNTANANFLITVRDKQSSNLSNGQVLVFNRGTVAAGNGVLQADSTHVTLVSSSNNSFIGDVVFTVKVTNAAVSAVARRTKTEIGNVSITALRATDSKNNATLVIG